jgi:hypothetical protein
MVFTMTGDKDGVDPWRRGARYHARLEMVRLPMEGAVAIIHDLWRWRGDLLSAASAAPSGRTRRGTWRWVA